MLCSYSMSVSHFIVQTSKFLLIDATAVTLGQGHGKVIQYSAASHIFTLAKLLRCILKNIYSYVVILFLVPLHESSFVKATWEPVLHPTHHNPPQPTPECMRCYMPPFWIVEWDDFLIRLYQLQINWWIQPWCIKGLMQICLWSNSCGKLARDLHAKIFDLINALMFGNQWWKNDFSWKISNGKSLNMGLMTPNECHTFFISICVTMKVND